MSPPNDQPARPRDRTISFGHPGQVEPSPRPVWPLFLIAALTPLGYGVARLVDTASRNLTDAYCSDSVDPDACVEGGDFPAATVGVLCALVSLGCLGAAVIVLARRRRSRRTERAPHA